MSDELWQVAEGQGPIAATAIHDGHDLREEVAKIMALSDADRLREEDPYTGIWTTVAPTQIIARRSRFEVDLNRPRQSAVYRLPEDAWGMSVWRQEPSDALIERSLAEFDAFYAEAQRVFREMERRFGRFIVLDLHTYNHRRAGADQPSGEAESNPDVNVGTGTLDHKRWASTVERFMQDLTSFDFLGRHLSVRENLKFRGGHFSRWIHENFSESACCLAIEFKKFFMDEWTGEVNAEEFELIPQALAATLPGLLESLEKLNCA